MPRPDTYERELEFLPYKESLGQVIEYVLQHAPQDGTVLDLMCGPGYLLGELQKQRKRLTLRGIDSDETYVDYARTRYPELPFTVADVRTWESDKPYDVVLCTGALHHLPYEEQEGFIERMERMMKDEGFGILSDCYIDGYNNETQRQTAAAYLGYQYLVATIANRAPSDVIEATAQILVNDVMKREFKTSIEKRLPVIQRVFPNSETRKVWPNSEIGGYGDYVHILRK